MRKRAPKIVASLGDAPGATKPASAEATAYPPDVAGAEHERVHPAEALLDAPLDGAGERPRPVDGGQVADGTYVLVDDGALECWTSEFVAVNR